jgi:hypothetical protein
MKNKYIEYTLISLSISILLYLIASFISWDITWIKNISNWGKSDRVILVVGYLTKEGMTALIYNTIYINK